MESKTTRYLGKMNLKLFEGKTATGEAKPKRRMLQVTHSLQSVAWITTAGLKRKRFHSFNRKMKETNYMKQ